MERMHGSLTEGRLANLYLLDLTFVLEWWAYRGFGHFLSMMREGCPPILQSRSELGSDR
jgi:hypothetical protein